MFFCASFRAAAQYQKSGLARHSLALPSISRRYYAGTIRLGAFPHLVGVTVLLYFHVCRMQLVARAAGHHVNDKLYEYIGVEHALRGTMVA